MSGYFNGDPRLPRDDQPSEDHRTDWAASSNETSPVNWVTDGRYWRSAPASRLRRRQRGAAGWSALRFPAIALALAVTGALIAGSVWAFFNPNSTTPGSQRPSRGAASASPRASASVGAGARAYDHVVVIVMENHGYSAIIGNSSAAPYINETLLPQGALAANYTAIGHPSLPNYLALTAGDSFATTDCWPADCPVNAFHLGDTLSRAGRTWKAYMESMPAACYTQDAYPYAVRHNPWVYFDDLRADRGACGAHDAPYTQLGVDLQTERSTPSFIWITPNLTNDMHDGTIAQGDSWLAAHVPVILNSPAFTRSRSLLVLTWDEDDGGTDANRVATIFIGSGVKAGYRSSVAYTHYSLLKTVEYAWGLPALTTNDLAASPMTDLLSSTTSGSIPTTSGAAAASFPGLNTAAANFHYTMAFNYQVPDDTAERGKVDYVWGAQAGSQQAGVYNAFYYPFERDAGQNVEPTGHDLTWWKANHPDWLEYKCDRVTLAYEFGDPNVPLDIANTGFRAYVMQNYVDWAFAHGYSGIAFDNVDVQNNFGRCGHFDRNGVWTPQYSGEMTDFAYASEVLSWARDMTARIHATKAGSTVAINFRYNNADPNDSNTLLSIIDIDADEGGWTNYGSGAMTDAAWVQYDQDLTRHVTGVGKGLLQSCQEPVEYANITRAQVQWCMANYFLVKNAATYMGITGTDGYGYLEYRPEYAAARVGVPTDTYDLVPRTGVYRRYFSNGLALVNPSSTATFTVSIPPNTYVDLYGDPQGGSVTLQPASGIVLVSK